MSKTVVCTALFLLSCSASWAIINPRFTPVHLVAESDMIVAGSLEATNDPQQWKLSAPVAIKGKPPASIVLSLSGCEKDHLDQITHTFKGNRGPVVLFAGEKDGRRQARLHIMGEWLNVQDAKGRWQVLDSAPDMDGTFSGGSDMLIRMARYIVRDAEADVPVTAGVKWTAHVTVGKAPGEVAGLAAVDFTKVGQTHLFAGVAAGDRFFRASKEGTFDDVTAAANLHTRSRRFAWVDVDGDGLADLLSWDGEKLSVCLAGKDGTFHAADGLSLPLADCLGLAPCSTDGRPGVLVSRSGAPIAADGRRRQSVDENRAARRRRGFRATFGVRRCRFGQRRFRGCSATRRTRQPAVERQGRRFRETAASGSRHGRRDRVGRGGRFRPGRPVGHFSGRTGKEHALGK